MSADSRGTLLDGDTLLDDIASILARDGVELWGTAPSRAMEDERRFVITLHMDRSVCPHGSR